MKGQKKYISTILSTFFLFPLNNSATNIRKINSCPNYPEKNLKVSSLNKNKDNTSNPTKILKDFAKEQFNETIKKYKNPKNILTMSVTALVSREAWTVWNMIMDSSLPNGFPKIDKSDADWNNKLKKLNEIINFITWEDISQKNIFNKINNNIKYAEHRFWGILGFRNFEKICFNYMVNEHKGIPKEQIFAWNYILSELLEFSTKIFKLKETDEYVILFGKNFNNDNNINEERIYLFNPFACKRGRTKAYYSNISQEKMTLVSIDKDKIELQIPYGNNISDYFTYNKNTGKIEKK